MPAPGKFGKLKSTDTVKWLFECLGDHDLMKKIVHDNPEATVELAQRILNVKRLYLELGLNMPRELIRIMACGQSVPENQSSMADQNQGG